MGWFRMGGALGAGAWALLWMSAGWAQASESLVRQVDFQGRRASFEAQQVAQWAFDRRDAQGKPFAIVDKKEARLFVFAGDGRLAGTTPVLLGLARGDDSAPGVGQRVATGLRLDERTTPAGRFESVPGHNDKGEAIVWVDYGAALAIHRLRPADPAERRPQRLASETPDDNRISLGCVVVVGSFYDEVVAPLLGQRRGVVYVLPETRELAAVFALAPDAEL